MMKAWTFDCGRMTSMRAARSLRSPLLNASANARRSARVSLRPCGRDVIHEDAESGLIVTSSSLFPGARKTCIARGYRIDEANRESLRKWIQSMRTPGTGVFLGE
jgi:restriction system protein